MKRLIAIIGHISAGKTTTAKHLAALLKAQYLGSDDLRTELFGTIGAESEGAEFAAMRERVAIAHDTETTIVLDSTGMTPAFRSILEDYRADTHIVLLFCNRKTWQARELGRADRPPLDIGLLVDSGAAAFLLQPDTAIDTTDLTPDAIAKSILTWLRTQNIANHV